MSFGARVSHRMIQSSHQLISNYTYILCLITILKRFAKMLAGIIFIILTIGIVAPIIIAIVAYIVAIIDNATKDER